MTSRALWKSAILAGLAAIAPLGLPMPAHADLIVTITDETAPGSVFGPTIIGAGSPTAVGGVSGVFPTSVGDFTIAGGSANETQTAAASQAVSTSLNIINNADTAQTLSILIQATGFTAPVPSANVRSSFSGTTLGGPNSGSFQSSVGATVPSNVQTLQTPPLDPSFDDTINGIASGLAAPFSIFQRIRFTLAAGAQVNFTGRTVLTAVPEPSVTVMLGVAGLLGLGCRTIRRKRATA